MIYWLTALALLNYASYKGSKVLITLFAIELGASPLLVGVIYAMYSVFPILMAVYAGRLADRIGVRVPILFATAGMAGGLLAPWLMPSLIGLVASAILVGMFYIFFHVSVQSATGFMKGDRSQNYSMLSLANAGSAFVGPVAVGLSIDAGGHAATYALIGVLPLVALACFVLMPGIVPGGRRASKKQAGEGGTVAMLREHPSLRGILLGGVAIEAALELYMFYMPLYGHSIGLSATKIGSIMGVYAAATLAIRLLTPWLVRKLGEESVLRLAMLLAAGVYCAFPLAATPVMLALLSFVLGLGLGCCVPLSMMIIHARAPSGREGEAVGVRQAINKVTDLGVPLFFGSLGTAIGMLPMFWLASAFLIGGTTLVSLRGRAPESSAAPAGHG